MGLLDRYRKQTPPPSNRPPRSAAGRAHNNGFLQLEELNSELQGVLGLELFDIMYRTDGDIRQVIAMSCNPIIAGTWTVVPCGGKDADKDAVEQAEFVQWALFEAMEPGLKAHLAEMLPALARWGFCIYEETWQAAQKDGKAYLVPRKLDLRLPRTIVRWFQDRYGNLTSVVQQLPIPLNDLVARGYSADPGRVRKASNGETLQPGEVELPANNIIYYRLGGEGDNWEGVSLLRPAYKHWFLKDAIERIDAIAQEREAVGIPICYPPMGATPRQLEEMELVLAAMRTNDQGYIIAPGPKAGQGAADGQGWLIEVIGYDRTGSGRDPQPSLEYHTAKIAAAFIAEFIRLGHGGGSGSRAVGQVQVDPFMVSIEAMANIVEAALQPLVDKIIAYNFPNAKHSPRLKMSLVDSTSLSQLADYVLKLAQVGAMLPDQQLEDFLRERADLPPSDPSAVKERGKQDNKMRQEIVTGGGQNGDANGANGGPAKPGSAKTGTSKPSGASKPRTHSVDAAGRRVRYRDYRPQEEHVRFDQIEDYLDDLPDIWAVHCQLEVLSLARGEEVDLRGRMNDLMQSAYQQGAAELQQELSLASTVYLSVRDMGLDGIAARLDHADQFIRSAMQLGAMTTRLNRGDDDAAVQLAAETEGLRSLRRVALSHGQGAYMQGRQDAITLAADQSSDIQVLYVAMLDRNCCAECEAADDGIPRSLDDPLRVQRRPPNQDCYSTQSGHNMCRCIEVPVIAG